MNSIVIDKEAQKKSRIKLLAVFFIFLGPLLLAFIWLEFVKNNPGYATFTHGELITPAQPITAFALQDMDGQAFGPDSINQVWTMMYFTNGPCTEICEQNLYHMRQVRLSLVQNMDRVQRVTVVRDRGEIPPEMIEQHPGLYVLSGTEEQYSVLEKQISEAESALEPLEDSIYLIDPHGNLMMRFSADLNPKGMLKDIKHLLKVSRIG